MSYNGEYNQSMNKPEGDGKEESEKNGGDNVGINGGERKKKEM